MIAGLKANMLASVLGLAAALFLIIAVAQSIQIDGFLWIDGLKDKVEACENARAELKRISTAKNEQKAETSGNIKKAGTIRDKAEGEARKIEQAPTAPNCATPPEVMGADL